jgi:hypothetical protein
MFPSAIGPQNWLMKPMPLAMTPDNANPLARVVVSKASEGTTACSGV